MTYTRRQLAETLRTPVMFLTVVLVPVAVMLFFIVPFVGDNPSTMTYGTATMAVFAVMLACVGHFSISVAALRESAWGSYLRTLPGGLAPQAVGHLLVGMVVVAAAVVPIIVVAWLFTAANAPIGRVLLAVGAFADHGGHVHVHGVGRGLSHGFGRHADLQQCRVLAVVGGGRHVFRP